MIDKKDGFCMDKKEFFAIRSYLGKTQKEMAQLLGVSLKAVQSFEQGWRNIPPHAERQILFLLAKRRYLRKKNTPCWVVQKCPMETRKRCPAWEFRLGELCWFINGTICQEEAQESWPEKMRMCRHCKVFKPILDSL
jgi:hypothetical protein